MKIFFMLVAVLSLHTYSKSLIGIDQEPRSLNSVHEIVKPTLVSTGEYISYKSNANGVCKYLGFERSLLGSKKAHVDHYIYYGPDLVVPVYTNKYAALFKENGSFEEVIYGHIIGSIKCLKMNEF